MDGANHYGSVREYLNRPRLSIQEFEKARDGTGNKQDVNDILTLVEPESLEEYYELVDSERAEKLQAPIEYAGNPLESIKEKLDKLRECQKKQREVQDTE